jgi:hypothetical protein
MITHAWPPRRKCGQRLIYHSCIAKTRKFLNFSIFLIFSQLLLAGMHWPVTTLHDHNKKAADLKTGGPRYRPCEVEADIMSLDNSRTIG